MSFTCAIIDDEPGSRELLEELAETRDDLELIGSWGDPVEAINQMESHRPDVILLDVEMPGLDGFELLASLDWEPLPVIVFVTAYDEYAVRAFEVNAVDYLMKPVGEERFEAAMDRAARAVRERRRKGGVADAVRDEALRSFLHDVAATRGYLQRIPVKSGSRIRLVPADRIDLIESAGNYARLHSGKESFLIRDSLSRLEERLDPAQFLRVHRRYIVNVTRVEELDPLFRGEYMLVLGGGRRIGTGRTYRDVVRETFEI